MVKKLAILIFVVLPALAMGQGAVRYDSSDNSLLEPTAAELIAGNPEFSELGLSFDESANFTLTGTWDFSGAAGLTLTESSVTAHEGALSIGWGQVTGTPTTLVGYGITDAATSAQGALADTALQPGDNISELTNDSGFITSETDDQDASEVAVTPVGDIAATDVQAAIEELDGEKQADLGNIDGIVEGDGAGNYSAATDVTGIVSAASTTTAGKVELATAAEVAAGTDTSRAVTPAGLQATRKIVYCGGSLTTGMTVFGTLSLAGAHTSAVSYGTYLVFPDSSSNKMAIPVPLFWGDTIRITGGWSSRALTGGSANVYVRAVPTWPGVGTVADQVITLPYGGTATIVEAQTTVNFATTAKSGNIRYIEYARRAEATDTSTQDAYLNYVIIEDISTP